MFTNVQPHIDVMASLLIVNYYLQIIFTNVQPHIDVMASLLFVNINGIPVMYAVF